MLKYSLLGLLLGFALITFVQGQDQSGFISIDCGLTEGFDYTDDTTGIYYNSDAGFVESGSSNTISPNFKQSGKQFLNVRSFPLGVRNCYTLRPAGGKNNKYLIRARFMYGNYDAENKLPEFDLHIGVDSWVTVSFDEEDDLMRYEIIHTPTSDYINFCLINTGRGIPFISSLELRPLNNSLYTTSELGSLIYKERTDLSSSTDDLIRYKDDIYDRIWKTYSDDNYTSISAVSINDWKSNNFQVPAFVMRTAIAPKNVNDSLYYSFVPNSITDQVYIYMHFAEVESLQSNQYRAFNINLNGKFWYGPISPAYKHDLTIYSTSSEREASYEFTLTRTQNSTHPPIINAIEIYSLKQLSDRQTDEKDVAAMNGTKSMYGVTRNWQGDPCAPKVYVWDGLKCSYFAFDPPRIISMNLSSSNLTGNIISPYIINLTMIQSLDLSNNNLTGVVPDFLALLPSLRILNLKGNNFTGSVPDELLQRSNSGSLSLSIDNIGENTSPCQSSPCKRKNKKIIIPVAASVVTLFVILLVLIIVWMIKRRRKQPVLEHVDAKSNENEGVSLEIKRNPQFSYFEILGITNNFHRVVGKGGFGTVYHGYVGDTQVAVKMLSSSSIQGYKEFQTEAKLLMSVHHKNLTSLVGYCNNGTNMGIIYEYMAYGDLARHLSGKTTYVLSWPERLQIAMDTAQGLEYLHHGCKPPIIHRDVKSTNILLDENFRAKLADFGMSRVFQTEGGSHVSTIIAGTPGYLDPEYSMSNRLTEKSDVYSYGVVLLEIVTGRPPLVKQNHITQWVNSMLEKGDVKSMVDPRLQGDFDVNCAWKVIELAMHCVSRSFTKRPSMNHVVNELRWCLEMELAHSNKEYDGSNEVIPFNVGSDLGPRAR